MKFKFARALLCGIAVAGAFGAASAQEKTQWDGVYTVEQAQRGEQLYAEHCASCHGPDLSGGEMAPGLTGGDFATNWNDLTLGQLFDRIRTSMPQSNPGSLNRQQVADIIAFVLSRSNFPPGTSELSTTAEELGAIKFAGTKPDGK